MLVHDYFYYFSRIAGASLFTRWGILSVVILAVAGYCFFSARKGLATTAILVALVSFTIGIYAAEYEIPEDSEQQGLVMNDSDWESCGTGLAKPTPSGYGMSNPCGWGCFRGATIRKTMTMGEFPPWPRFQREVECWRRKGPWAAPQQQDPQPGAAANAAATH